MRPTREEVAAREELAELRALLAADVRPHVDTQRLRLEDHEARHVERLAAELPAAIEARSDEGPALGRAMATSVEQALKVSIARDPSAVVDAIAPIMGAAIRRAVADALVGLTQSFNVVLDNSLSPRAIVWRIEAWRTGHTFAEVALLHSLVYRVEQIFLIHRETGLVLQHVVAPTIVANDADMVSGMLTAIQDFVRDSFGGGGGDLDAMQVGATTVWVERTSGIALAAVLRGVAPASLRDRLRDALGEVERRFGRYLTKFSGDAAPFEPTRAVIEPCLEQQQRPASRFGGLWVLLGLVGAVAVAYGVSWLLTAPPAIEAPSSAPVPAPVDPWPAYVERLQRTPGILVVEATPAGAPRRIRGLRDPLAAEPAMIAAEFGIDASAFEARWTSFQSLEPALVQARAQHVLRPPAGVRLTYSDGVLAIEGAAEREWVESARTLAPALGGVDGVAWTVVETDSREEAWDGAVAAVERVHVEFAVGSSSIEGPQLAAVDDLARALVDLDRVAVDHGRVRDVELVGHADQGGSPRLNAALRQARTDAVLAALGRLELRRIRLRAASLPGEDTSRGRVVGARVVVGDP